MATRNHRPLLPKQQRDHLARMAHKALQHLDRPERAYAQGVVDTLSWLCGEDMTPLLDEVTR